MARKKTEKLPTILPDRIPSHGGGRLRTGNPGHVGAGGRPPSAIRASMRESLDKRLHIAEQIAEDEDANPTERLKALELLARYGLGHSDTVTSKQRFASDDERRARLRELLDRIESR